MKKYLSLVWYHFQQIAKVAFVPIHKEGVTFVLLGVMLALILGLVSRTLFWLCVVLCLGCYYFFRDPERFSPDDEDIVVSPADGKVVEIVKDASVPTDLKNINTKMQRISIFLSILNVHINRIPISGTISECSYHAGKFLSADTDKASEENERQSCVVKTADGQEIVFVQIAGLVARRIVCDLKQGEQVTLGERYGLIRFGSRCDIYLPKDAKIRVKVGQTMVGAETILAQLAPKNNKK